MASPFYRVAEVLEVDTDLGEIGVCWRLEILQAVDSPTRFRYRAWELEFFRLRPTFPQNEQGEPIEASDDQLFVVRPLPRQRPNSLRFEAPSLDAARDIAVLDLRRSLEHMTATPAGD